jgi:hypothetical protein
MKEGLWVEQTKRGAVEVIREGGSALGVSFLYSYFIPKSVLSLCIGLGWSLEEGRKEGRERRMFILRVDSCSRDEYVKRLGCCRVVRKEGRLEKRWVE